jgi:16S rRNA (adenine1518-N6/adenine1519-N6)-dimethyltransferase
VIYNNKSELLEMLKKNGLWLNKRLGQNFLINTHVIDQTLENNIKEQKNIEIINQDALQFSLPTTEYKLVANIPYYITSPLLNHFLNPKKRDAAADQKPPAGTVAAAGRPEQLRPTLIVLLVQKEVADKVCSTAGDHSVLSLEVQLFGKPHVETKVSRTGFFPEPKVDSAILKIKTYETPLIEDTETFFRLIKAAFNQKRKTLNNSLKNGLRLTKEQVETIFKNAGLDLAARPQSLEIEDWKKLVAEYKKVC